ncbi:MAG: hypothetical protein VB934_04010 [Polyangiaceae bacterium]
MLFVSGEVLTSQRLTLRGGSLKGQLGAHRPGTARHGTAGDARLGQDMKRNATMAPPCGIVEPRGCHNRLVLRSRRPHIATIDLRQSDPEPGFPARLGITIGTSYLMDIFHAERHASPSNVRIQTTIDRFKPVDPK